MGIYLNLILKIRIVFCGMDMIFRKGLLLNIRYQSSDEFEVMICSYSCITIKSMKEIIPFNCSR